MGLKNFLIYSLVLLTGLKLTISEFAGNANYEEPGKCHNVRPINDCHYF